MSDLNLETLPVALRDVHTRPLFVLELEVKPILNVGATPAGERHVGLVSGGRFSGQRLAGKVLEGNDWQSVRAGGASMLDVRLILQADTDDLITMTYQGIRRGTPGTPTEYFRSNPQFETASTRYGWLNEILTIGVGWRRGEAVLYSVFEVL